MATSTVDISAINRTDPRYQEAYRQRRDELQGFSDDALLAAKEHDYAKYRNLCHDSDLSETYRVLLKARADACDDALAEAAYGRPVVFIRSGQTNDEPESIIPTPPDWPQPPKSEAYYGLAGEIVDALEPATEADPVALLITLLTVVGNIVGVDPHWEVSGTRHSLRINPVFVGPTSKARKGTSWGTMKALLSIAAPEWLAACVKSGLSSGEGLIWAVRDEIRKTEAVREKGRIVE